ncbi:SwmB domain-containing protein [Paenibacillus azoreducens]|uniref:SwmB domain-containing protein n=1 Tax=Paenibacillus azoreducens TaxID=116718 RepID=UPI0039F5789C
MRKALIYLLVVLIAFVDLGSVKALAAADPVGDGPEITISVFLSPDGKNVKRQPRIVFESKSQVNPAFGTDSNGPRIQLVNEATSGKDITIDPKVITEETNSNKTRYFVDINGPLEFGAKYLIKADKGAFKDNSDVPSKPAEYRFETIQKLDVKTTDPANNATGVDISLPKTLTITFNDIIELGTGSVTVYKSNGEVVETISTSDSKKLTVDGPGLFISLSKPLEKGTSYYVIVPKGVVKSYGTEYEGITAKTQWTFKTTGTSTSITSKSPANWSTGVSPGTRLQLTYNQPVYPSTGSISLYKNGSWIKSIPANSTQGSGTKTITIDTGSSLDYNANYYVLVPDNAFRDSDNNNVAGISSSNEWSFTTSSTTSGTSLNVDSFSPTNRSTGVAQDADLVMNFNREVQRGYGRVSVRKSGSDQEVPTDVFTYGTREVRIRLLPGYRYDTDSTYYVTIERGAFYERQNPNNVYAGLSGSSWTFSTSVTDKTPPVLKSSEMYSNSTIRLVYNKMLYSDSWLSTSMFTVTVNDETRRIYNVYTSGDSVYILLETGVAVGQNVKITYKGGTNGIRDSAGNAVPAISQREVVNGIDTALPKPSSGSVSYNKVTLNFSQPLRNVSSNAYEQFTVKADGSPMNIQSISQSGQTLYLTLNVNVSDGQVITVSYTPGNNPIQDDRGQNISAFSDFFVRNYLDTKPPVFQSAEGAGNKVVLTYNEPLSTYNFPMKSQFSVLVNGAPNYVSAIEIKDNKVTLTLTSALSKDAKVTVSYVPGSGSTRLTDLNGNAAGYVNLETVKVSENGLNGEIKALIVQGDMIQIIYNKTLQTQSYVAKEQYQVYVDGTLRGVTQASASGNTVTLKLSSAVTSGQRVEVTYLPGSSGVTDSSGNKMSYFNKLLASYSTGNSFDPNRPGYLIYNDLKEFGTSTFSLSDPSLVMSDITSRNNQLIKKISVDPEKLKGAFDYIGTANEKTHMLMFQAPTGYSSILVSIPLDALEIAFGKDKNAVIAVRAGDAMHVLQLSQLHTAEISRSLNASSNSIALNIVVEKLGAEAAAQYNTKISSASMQKVTEPYDFYVTAVNTNSSASSIDVTMNNQYWMISGMATPGNKIGLFKWDAASETMTFVPALVQAGGDRQVFRAKIKGNHTVFGGTTYQYFNDVGNHWAKEAVNTLAGKLIVSGRTKTSFAPNQNITRAEFAEYIARGLGLAGEVGMAQRFYDVTNTKENAFIGAAVKAGIITGYSDGSFKPNKSITREEMAMMMMRAMNYSDYRTTLTFAPEKYLQKFKDYKQIQAVDAVAKLLNEGIIQGVSANAFQPKGQATRAQAAVMLQRLLEKIQYM